MKAFYMSFLNIFLSAFAVFFLGLLLLLFFGEKGSDPGILEKD